MLFGLQGGETSMRKTVLAAVITYGQVYTEKIFCEILHNQLAVSHPYW